FLFLNLLATFAVSLPAMWLLRPLFARGRKLSYSRPLIVQVLVTGIVAFVGVMLSLVQLFAVGLIVNGTLVVLWFLFNPEALRNFDVATALSVILIRVLGIVGTLLGTMLLD